MKKLKFALKKMVTSLWQRKIVIVDYEQIEIYDCPASILESFALFQTRIRDFSYPISDLNFCP